MKRQEVEAGPNKPASISVAGGGRYGWAGQVRAPQAGVTVSVHGVDNTSGTAPIGSKAIGAGQAVRIDDILPARSAGAGVLRVDIESAEKQKVFVSLSWVEP